MPFLIENARDYLIELIYDAGKDYLKEKKDENEFRSMIADYIERQDTYNEICSLDEEIDFQGLSEYLSGKFFEKIAYDFFSPDPEKRNAVRTHIITSAEAYSKTKTAEGKARVKKIVADCIDIVDGFYRSRIELKALALADEIVTALAGTVEKNITEAKEEILTAIEKTNPPRISSHLRVTLDALLEDRRNNHSSFKLMRPDELDSRLCPGVKDSGPLPSLGSEENGEKKPVWTLISESWSLSENHSIVIEGEGGIGKTVTLLSPGLQGTVLPVPAMYIPLYELVDDEGECLRMDEYLKRRLPNHRKEILALAEEPWQNGPRLLLLLDGFNEIPQKHRFTVLGKLNEWRKSRTGVQLITVSRPMDGLDLSKELTGSPISLKLLPLDKPTVLDYLANHGVEPPKEDSPVWKVLNRPLFLVLYTKTDMLKGQTAAGYPLRPKEAVSGGALIWNYLQREMLRDDKEKWVLPCAVACQHILPFVAFRMAKEQRFTIEEKELKALIQSAVSALDPEHLPEHLWELYDLYEQRHGSDPAFSEADWLKLILRLEILTRHNTGKKRKRSYTFLHQHFRDALSGMYLVGQAEAAPEGELPEVWERSHGPEQMEYAAELMEEETAKKLWKALRALWPEDQKQQTPNRAALYTQLELHRRRDDLAGLDFSEMDLQGISLIRYEKGLFRRENGAQWKTHMRGTKLDAAVFQGVGHNGTVSCVTALPDGRIVSGSVDETLRVWDSYTGDCLRVLEGHTSWVTSVTALPDGRIVSGSEDNTLRVWDLDSGDCLRVLEGHTRVVSCVTTLSDGRIISGSWDRTLRVWDPDTWESRELKGHTKDVNCVAALPDGRIVSGSDDNTLRVWDPDTGSCLRVLEGHTWDVNCVTALPDDRIVSGSDDETLRVWNPNTGNCLRVLVGHYGFVNCVTALPDGRIVSGSYDNTLRVWDPNTGSCLRVLEGHTDWVRCVTVLPDGRIVSGADDRTLRIWSSEGGEPLARLGQIRLEVRCAAIAGENRWVSGHSDGTLRLWDSNTGACLRELKGHTHAVQCVTTLPDGRIISGLDDNTLRVWDLNTGKNRLLEEQTFPVECVTALTDGRIVSGSWDNTLQVWDPDTGECLRVLEGHRSHVLCVISLPDGRIVSGSWDNTLLVWDPNTGECLRVLKGHSSSVRCVTALPDGRIVSGSEDNTLRVWDPNTGDCLRVLKGHTFLVNSVTALPGGRIVSGSMDDPLRVWDPDTGSCLRVLEGHRGSVNCVTALPDGRILSGSRDCTFRVWDAGTGDCLAVIPISEMDVTGMDLSQAEIKAPDLARLLYYNGAEVPERYAEQFRAELAT